MGSCLGFSVFWNEYECFSHRYNLASLYPVAFLCCCGLRFRSQFVCSPGDHGIPLVGGDIQIKEACALVCLDFRGSTVMLSLSDDSSSILADQCYTDVGEMIVGPRKTLFMDEISTGLDSSTTFQIVKCVRNFVHQMEATVLMALLQPAPETFDLFDDLVLLSEGYLVYQGPQEEVLDFFGSLGFRLPPRKGVADFLQEVVFPQEHFILMFS